MNSLLWLPLAALSAVFAALVAIFGKIGVTGIDTTLSTTVRAAFMFGFLLIASIVMGKLGGVGTIPGRTMLFIALSGLAGAASWFFYFWALKVGQATQVATIDRFSLVIVMVLSAVFLGENIGWQSGFGALLVTAGAIMISLAK